MSRVPRRFEDDFYEVVPSNVSRSAKRRKIDKNLNEINIADVNKERKKIKIHFVGFSEEFDGWR